MKTVPATLPRISRETQSRPALLPLVLALLIAPLAACSKAPEPAQPAQEKPYVLMEGQRAALDQARQTEQVIEDADARRRKEMEAQGL